MPYCPECGYEYNLGTRICPDCQTQLSEGKRLLCEACQEPVTEGATFCPHCGVLRTKDVPLHKPIILCETHRGVPAIGACVVCGKPVCDQCAVKKMGKFFCPDDEHVKMAFDWIAVCTTNTRNEAEMIKAQLEGAGLQAMVFSQSDRMFITNIGDLAVNEVMVPKASLDAAQAFLRSINIEPRVRRRSS